ncbi:MAG: aminotransferase class I/II-fold pyridoxal phosphate-dependent enzyme [Caldilineaceae bacterium]
MSQNARFSRKITELAQIEAPLFRNWENPKAATLPADACIFDSGNPTELPLPGYVAALQKWSVPQANDWFGYFGGEGHAKKVVANSLQAQFGRPYTPDDIIMTNGAFGALAVALQCLAEAGDEVIYLLPPWFFYEGMIHNTGAKPVAVQIRLDNFDLDLDAIAAALNEKTKAIVINSPNNPTGKIYPPATLAALAEILQSASERYGHPIYLISDEAYRRILYDNREFHSPTSYYPHSLMVYTYGKTLLNPGERLGYLAVSPEMPGREELQKPLFLAQAFTGFAIPNSLLMRALEDIEELCVDLNQLQRRRDRLVGALQKIGYQVHVPEATFYLFPRSPLADDWAFVDLLMEQKISCLPGSVVNLPGYFRLSLTANDAMIERSLAGFAAAFALAQSRN